MKFVLLGTSKRHFFFSLRLSKQKVVVFILFRHLLLVQVRYDVAFAHINEEIIFKDNITDSFSKDSISDSKVFNIVTIWLLLKPDLKLSPCMLLFIFLFLNGYDEIVYYFFFKFTISTFTWATCCPIKHVFKWFFATKESYSVKSLSQRLMTCQALLIHRNYWPFIEKRRA